MSNATSRTDADESGPEQPEARVSHRWVGLQQRLETVQQLVGVYSRHQLLKRVLSGRWNVSSWLCGRLLIECIVETRPEDIRRRVVGRGPRDDRNCRVALSHCCPELVAIQRFQCRFDDDTVGVPRRTERWNHRRIGRRLHGRRRSVAFDTRSESSHAIGVVADTQQTSLGIDRP